jgi:replicative DNA helicase
MAPTNGKPKSANGGRRDAFDRQPPFDVQAEIGLLGSLMLLPSRLAEISLLVSAVDFYDSAHAKLFCVMAAIVADGKPLDPTILIDRLKASGQYEAIGGSAYLSKIINAVPNAANLHWYAGIVADKATKRRVIWECTAILADAYDDRMEAGELTTALEAAAGKLSTLSTAHEAVALGAAAAEVVFRLREPEQRSGVNRAAWGLPSIDEDLGPIMPGEMCVIGARPGLGKTAFAQHILRHSAMRDRPALIISLEMTGAEIAGRELCRVTGVDSRSIRSGEVEPSDLNILAGAAQDFQGLPLYIWSPAKATLSQIRGMVAHSVAKHGVRLVAIDYIQLIEGQANTREDRRGQLSEISHGLKRLAKEFSLPLVVLSQINRQGDNAEPTLAMLRECGTIEEDADFVLFLHCEDPKADDKRTLIASKARAVGRGRRTLKWNRFKTEFSDETVRDCKNFDPAIDAWNTP